MVPLLLRSWRREIDGSQKQIFKYVMSLSHFSYRHAERSRSIFVLCVFIVCGIGSMK